MGAEYNYMDKAGKEQNGYSVYTTVNVSDEAAVYARWDDLLAGSTATSAAAIVGAQFKVGKYLNFFQTSACFLVILCYLNPGTDKIFQSVPYQF